MAFTISMILKMQFSTDLEYIDYYHSLSLTYNERLHSLQLQLSAIDQNESHCQLINDFITQHKQCQIVRGEQLLKQQARIAQNQEKESEIMRYESKIREQVYTATRKEDEIWEETWTGKRIKNIALHKQSLAMFHAQAKQFQRVVQELNEQERLKKQVDQLRNTVENNEKTQDQDPPFFDFRGVQSALLFMVTEEDTKLDELKALQHSLREQLRQVNNSHKILKQKYKNLISQAQKPESQPKEQQQTQEQGRTGRESSSKTISTEGDQPSVELC